MGKVKITALVELKLRELEEVLFNQGYFGFKDAAKEYVNSIYNFIDAIPRLKRSETKNSLYGAFYCSFKLNKNTTYFITFDVEDDIYLVKNVITNHTKDYPEFIKD